MTSRGSPRRRHGRSPSPTLNKVLANPYYMGLVTSQGVTPGRQARGLGRHRDLAAGPGRARHPGAPRREGAQAPALPARHHLLRGLRRAAGLHPAQRPRRPPHLLQHQEPLGSRYCPSRVIRLEKIEDDIAALYRRIELPEAEIQRLRLAVRGELARQTADAHENAERANRRLAQLTAEPAKLLRAHLDGAVPVDLLKTEMDRLMRTMAAAESEAAVAKAELGDVQQLLEQALAIAGSCWRHYVAAPTLCGGR